MTEYKKLKKKLLGEKVLDAPKKHINYYNEIERVSIGVALESPDDIQGITLADLPGTPEHANKGTDMRAGS